MMRRRPLMRAAVVGGGAYVAGRHMASRSASEQQQEADQDAPPSPPSPAQPTAPPLLDQLSQLDALHQQGALTDSEFTAAKAKLLG
jgi:Short C-terminal domain